MTPIQIYALDKNTIVLASLYKSQHCRSMEKSDAVIQIIREVAWHLNSTYEDTKFDDFKLYRSPDFIDLKTKRFLAPVFNFAFIPDRNVLLVGHSHSCYIDFFYKDTDGKNIIN